MQEKFMSKSSTSNKSEKNCYIVLLNWNNWKDTIECLESVLKSSIQNFRVIICDNNSTDDSVSKLMEWAEGKIEAHYSDSPMIKGLVYPYICKPLKYLLIKENDIPQVQRIEDKIIIVRNNKNGGFAYGTNVGIRLALQQRDCEYIWCLNNDTVIDPHCLENLVGRMKENPKIGICGSKLLNYYNPKLIQFYGGGIFNKWTSYQRSATISEAMERKLSFISGASMMINPSFLKEIGLMEEKYFLYYEELDWSARNNNKFLLEYCPDSIVYHKEGGTTGQINGKPSYLSDFYMIRNRILYTKKFYPYCLPTIYLGLLYAMFNRIKRGMPDRAWMILKLMVNPRKNLNKNYFFKTLNH